MLVKLTCESCGASSLDISGAKATCSYCKSQYSVKDIKEEVSENYKEKIESTMSNLKVNNSIIYGNMNNIKGNYNIIIGNMNNIKGKGNIAKGNMNSIKDLS